MSRTLIVDVQKAGWPMIHDAVVRFRDLRNRSPAYVIFLVSAYLERQLLKLLQDYDLADVSEVRRGDRTRCAALSLDEFRAL